MKSEASSLKTVINELDFLKKTVNIQWKIRKKKHLQIFPIKLAEKIPDPRNAKENYQSFIKSKNTTSVKQLKTITQQPKTFQNPNIVDIKSVIIEYPKTSYKLSKIIIQTETFSRVGFVRSVYYDTKKWLFFERKK